MMDREDLPAMHSDFVRILDKLTGGDPHESWCPAKVHADCCNKDCSCLLSIAREANYEMLARWVSDSPDEEVHLDMYQAAWLRTLIEFSVPRDPHPSGPSYWGQKTREIAESLLTGKGWPE